MAKIICDKCKTEFQFEIAKGFDACPVCGASMVGDDKNSHEEKPVENSEQVVGKKTYYYYDSGTLTDVLYSRRKPIYTFQAIDIEDAEEQLKEVYPNCPLFKSKPSKEIHCPRCFSSEYTLLNKGYSIFTGFLGSGRIKRVCNYCKKEF